MHLRIVLGLATVLLLGAMSELQADLGPPRPKPLPKGDLVIRVDNKVKEAQLIVPKKFLQKDKRGAWLSVPTVAVGACLALAFVSGGLWLLRKGNVHKSVATALLLLGIGLAMTSTYAYADRAPPRPKNPLLTGIPIAKDAKLTVVEKGDSIQLVVNEETYFRMLYSPVLQGPGPGKGLVPPGGLPKSSPPKPD